MSLKLRDRTYAILSQNAPYIAKINIDKFYKNLVVFKSLPPGVLLWNLLEVRELVHIRMNAKLSAYVKN